jgi:hypothetical protein
VSSSQAEGPHLPGDIQSVAAGYQEEEAAPCACLRGIWCFSKTNERRGMLGLFAKLYWLPIGSN